jgi:hypothetical protein
MNDLFERTMIEDDSIKDSIYTVNTDFSCRLDSVCYDMYDSNGYTEELSVMNNILNPFSIEKGDVLYFTNSTDNFNTMYISESKLNTTNKLKILNINKSKTSTNVSLPPSVNPGLKQIDVDYDKKRITVINKFK